MNMILGGINCSWGSKLPHGHSLVSHEWHELVSANGSRARTRDWHYRLVEGRRRRVETCGFQLLFKSLFLCLQLLLLISQLIFLNLLYTDSKARLGSMALIWLIYICIKSRQTIRVPVQPMLKREYIIRWCLDS